MPDRDISAVIERTCMRCDRVGTRGFVAAPKSGQWVCASSAACERPKIAALEAEVESLRGVLTTAVEELGGHRNKGSDMMRDELVDDFVEAARVALNASYGRGHALGSSNVRDGSSAGYSTVGPECE